MRNKYKNKSWIVLLVNLCRFILAVVFIFSGFVKAVDPSGTAYKIIDYFQHFHLTYLINEPFPTLFSIVQSVLEFGVGIYFLFGIRRKIASSLALVIMLLMTPLTLYIALADPVSDCGCFGDALILTNWETFIKNIILLFCSVVVFLHPFAIIRFISERNQWIISLHTVLFIGFFSLYSLQYLPILDFRPYHIGANIPQKMSLPEDAVMPEYATTFILEKNGEQKEFTLESYPDSTWTFIESRNKLLKKGTQPEIIDFSVSSMSGEELTDMILSDTSYTFLLISPHLEKADDGCVDQINDIYDYCSDNHYSFYCLTASTEKEITLWKDRTGAAYEFLRTDEIVLKTMIRSNPGLILMKAGTVVNKWSYNDLPTDNVLSKRLEQMPIAEIHPPDRLKELLKTLLWYLIPLLFFTLADRIWIGHKFYKRYKHKQIFIHKQKENEKENCSR